LGITGVRVWLLTGAGGLCRWRKFRPQRVYWTIITTRDRWSYSRLSGCFRIFAAKANWSRVYYFWHKRFRHARDQNLHEILIYARKTRWCVQMDRLSAFRWCKSIIRRRRWIVTKWRRSEYAFFSGGMLIPWLTLSLIVVIIALRNGLFLANSISDSVLINLRNVYPCLTLSVIVS
jgi:hypothetical protein